jgi:hypothetical protein
MGIFEFRISALKRFNEVRRPVILKPPEKEGGLGDPSSRMEENTYSILVSTADNLEIVQLAVFEWRKMCSRFPISST